MEVYFGAGLTPMVEEMDVEDGKLEAIEAVVVVKVVKVRGVVLKRLGGKGGDGI